MLIDTHGHLNFNAFKEDLDEVLKRTLAAGMGVIMPGTQVDTSRDAVELAEKINDPRIWAAVGLHPLHLEETRVDEAEVGNLEKFKTRGEFFKKENYEPFLKSKKIVAIGEVGLDYWRKPKGNAKREVYIKRQKDNLIAQLDLAVEYKKPALLHCRVAHDDLLEILKTHPIIKQINSPGVVHSFTGSIEQLNKFLELGFYIGVNALVFKLDFVEMAVREAPIERIVLETDAPYLLSPQEKGPRNEPLFIKHTAQKVAEIQRVPLEKVEEVTTENAKKLFHVDFT